MLSNCRSSTGQHLLGNTNTRLYVTRVCACSWVRADWSVGESANNIVTGNRIGCKGINVMAMALASNQKLTSLHLRGITYTTHAHDDSGNNSNDNNYGDAENDTITKNIDFY